MDVSPHLEGKIRIAAPSRDVKPVAVSPRLLARSISKSSYDVAGTTQMGPKRIFCGAEARRCVFL